MSGSDAQNTDFFDPSVLDSLYEAVGDDIKHIIFIYVEDFPKTIVEMKQALVNHDLETIGRLAHSLKSSSGNLGAVELVSISVSLESYANGQEVEEVSLSFRILKLEEAFIRVKPMLTGYAPR